MNLHDLTTEEQVESAFQQSLKAFSPPAGFKDSLRQRLAAAAATQRGVSRPTTPTRKLIKWSLSIAAACLAVTIIVSMFTSGPPMVQSAHAQFMEALATTRAAEWVHMTATQSGRNTEVWISPPRLYAKTDGRVLVSDCDQKRSWSYSADNRTLTIFPDEGDKIVSSHGDFSRNFLAELEKKAEQEGCQVSRATRTVEGVTYLAYVLSDGQSAEKDVEVLVAAETGRISRFTIGKAGPTVWTVDYPQDGPKDMYELGVPADARVIDLMPTPNVAELDQKVEAARKAFAPTYFAIICSAHVEQAKGQEGETRMEPLNIYAVYKNEGRFRIEGYSGSLLGKVSIEDMKGLEEWIKTQAPACVEFISASGKSKVVTFDWNSQQILVRPNLSSDSESTVERLTWDLPWTTRGASVVKEGQLLLRSHAGMKLQYDPQRDYARVRLERTAPPGNAIVSIESLRQTPKGQWYAERCRRIITNGGGESSSVIFIVHLDAGRTIPSELLDLDKVSTDTFTQARGPTQSAQPTTGR